MDGDSLDTLLSEEQRAIQQRKLLLAFIAKMESIPDDSPPDGFSNRDHDQLIYGH